MFNNGFWFYWTMSQFSLIAENMADDKQVRCCQPSLHWWSRGLISFPFDLLVISPTNLNLFSWFVIRCGSNQSCIPRCLWTQSLDSCSHQNTRAVLLINVYGSVMLRLFTHGRLKLQRRTVKVMRTYFCQWLHTVETEQADGAGQSAALPSATQTSPSRSPT